MIGHVIARQPFNRRCISGWRPSRHDGDLIPSGHPLIQYRDGSVHRLEPEQLVRLMDDAEQLGDFLGAQPAGLPEVKSGQLFKGDLVCRLLLEKKKKNKPRYDRRESFRVTAEWHRTSRVA